MGKDFPLDNGLLVEVVNTLKTRPQPTFHKFEDL